MDQAYLASIACFAGNFAPRGWQLCNGQILPIAQNTALFSLLGTTYGGNGQTTFALPNLQGRVPVGMGNGPGLSPIVQGELAGNASVTLTINNLPAHAHNGNMAVSLPCDSNPGTESAPDSLYPAAVPQGFAAGANSGVTMKAPTYSNVTIGIAGSSLPISVMPSYLCVNYIICMQGIFPSRN
jgi:microcystin-dependent protein